jgi:hypothetical protein
MRRSTIGDIGTRSCPDTAADRRRSDTRKRKKNSKVSKTGPDPPCCGPARGGWLSPPALCPCHCPCFIPPLPLLDSDPRTAAHARTHARTHAAHTRTHTQEGRSDGTCSCPGTGPCPPLTGTHDTPPPPPVEYYGSNPALRVVRDHVRDGSVGGEPEHGQEGAVEGADLSGASLLKTDTPTMATVRASRRSLSLYI